MPMITLVCTESIDDESRHEALGIIAARLQKDFAQEMGTFILRQETINQGDFIIIKGGQIRKAPWSPVVKVVLSERHNLDLTARLLKTLAQAAAEALKTDTAEVTVYAERLGSGCFFVKDTLI